MKNNLIVTFIAGEDVAAKTYNIGTLLFTIAHMKNQIGMITIHLPSGEESPVRFLFEYGDGFFSKGIMAIGDRRVISYLLDDEYAPLKLALAAQIAFNWLPYTVPSTEHEFRALIETIQERRNPETDFED